MKYSWKGTCGCLTGIDYNVRRPHEIYWWKADDGSRLLMKWNTRVDQMRTGGYAEARKTVPEIEYVTTDPLFQSRYPYPVIGLFGQGWDDLSTLSDEFIKVAATQSTPDRRVIVSDMTDFFVDFERNYGSGLPEYNASFGNEWDLYTSSMQEVSSRVRRSVEKLRAAEAMAALVSVKRSAFMTGRNLERDRAWLNLGLYWEHDWTADSYVVPREARAAWGRRLVGEIEAYVDTLHADAAAAMAQMIPGKGKSRRFFAFNPLGWVRTDAADVVWDGEGQVHVVDAETGVEVPSQIENRSVHGVETARRYLRILATDLPAVGYRVYEIRPGAGTAFPVAAEVQTGVAEPSGHKIKGTLIENSHHRLIVADRGAIMSWKAKARGDREMLRYEYETRSNDLGLDVGGNLIVEQSGPVSVTLKAASASPLDHTSRITLYRQSDRIDIANEITENFDGTHAWTFDFALKVPVVRHEEVGTIATAKLRTDGGHYAPTLSNLKWLTLNHFADMSGEGDVGVTLSNADLAFMQLGNSGTFRKQTFLDTRVPRIKVLAGGQIDGPQAGIPKQGGDSHFLHRFALRSHGGYDAAVAMRFALEHQNPPVTQWLAPGDAELPPTEFSLLQNSNADVLLWALKPAEVGPRAGLVARVWNVGSSEQDYQLSLSGGIAAAVSATHIETDTGPLMHDRNAVRATAAPTQIQTIRIVPRR